MIKIKTTISGLIDSAYKGPDYQKRKVLDRELQFIAEDLLLRSQEYGKRWRSNSGKRKYVDGWNDAIRSIIRALGS